MGIGGDVNEILSIGERSGCLRSYAGMREFSSFENMIEVSNLPMLGRKFTRCNVAYGDNWSKLDGFLLHPEWLENF